MGRARGFCQPNSFADSGLRERGGWEPKRVLGGRTLFDGLDTHELFHEL